MSNDKDSQLIWENYFNKKDGNDVMEEEMYDCVRDYMSDGYSRAEAEKMCSGRGYDERTDEAGDINSNKFRGPGAPGVNLARGYLLQALELIEDEDVHLCADANALKTTIHACKSAIGALSNDMEEVPGMMQEELDRGDEAGDYVSFLKNMARELVNNDMPEDEAFENVLSHPFEETYGEYLRVKGVAGIYTAARTHIQLAEKMGAYHEVDMNALQNWKYSE